MEIGIKGHLTRNKEVVEILEMLGGDNQYKIVGGLENHFYYIDDNQSISNTCIGPDEIKGYEIFSVEEFWKKFPYKVGDKVDFWLWDYYGRSELETSEIKSMRWNCARCEVAYRLKDKAGEIYRTDIKGKVNDDGNLFHTINEYEDIVEKSFQGGYEKCKLDIQLNGYELPDGHHFTDENENVIDATKILIKKNNPTYTKDHDEEDYCEVLGYKVDDVIFTNDTGWIKITNKLWDCYAKEHVYEGIGIMNGHEYKDIRHHNVIEKMQSEDLNHCNDEDDEEPQIDYSAEILKSMSEETEKRRNEFIMEALYTAGKTHEVLEKRGFTLPDGYHFSDGSGNVIDATEIRLVKNPPYYPKTYDECCDVLNIPNDERYIEIDVPLDYNKSLFALTRLLICRDAYWKIAGEWLELDKPWEPDWTNENQPKYGLYKELKDTIINPATFVFPTEETRDAFYENFKDLIEFCKSLL